MKKTITVILLATLQNAHADVPKERPYLIRSNISLIDDATALWANPANMGYRSGTSSRFLFNSHQMIDPDQNGSSLEFDSSYAYTGGPVGFGVAGSQILIPGSQGLGFDIHSSRQPGVQVPRTQAQATRPMWPRHAAEAQAQARTR